MSRATSLEYIIHRERNQKTVLEVVFICNPSKHYELDFAQSDWFQIVDSSLLFL